MGLPLYRKIPRDFPYQPEPTGWVQFLAWESSDDDSLAEWNGDIPYAVGRGKQNTRPGIMPCNRETMETNMYKHLDTFRIRCGGASGHETNVHNLVVLEQSEWLRDQVAGREDPDAPVLIPSHIKWWQVAWALEYMYEGRVPGFHLLAGEDWPKRCPGAQPRSIAWGLLELWEAAHFFGLDGLEKRVVRAFESYFWMGLQLAIRIHDTDGPLEETAWESRISLIRPEVRIAHEFCQAAWRLFGDPDKLPDDYFGADISNEGWRHCYREGRDPIAENGPAIREWESAMFDEIGTPDDGDGALERLDVLYDGLKPQYAEIFGDMMIHLPILLSKVGLFELKWFQDSMAHDNLMLCPHRFRNALTKRMEELVDEWPSDEYPRAPFSFERVDPWRLIASNARPVPGPSTPQRVEQEEPAVEQ
ncbi:hypothetical protein F5883DRAFT_74508 [Diaporthe sp. PMI_573]|nr:hypothetical protein F5883DRAFT_74508 [Diaporthaceae sp. PMI_573]